MGKILLTSAGFYTDAIRSRFLHCIKINPEDARISIITTASNTEKWNNEFVLKTLRDFHEMGMKNVRIVDIEFEEPEILRQSDVIFLNGGNPFNLLYHLKESGADKIIREFAENGGLLVGVSTGSIVLGPDIKLVEHFFPEEAIEGLEELTGLGITDVRVFPHYGDERLYPDKQGRKIEERLLEFERAHRCSVNRLRDDGAIVL
ncbi:Type 1 glutamine amidotransferase-like domain-containing protein [Bacillus cihuensis]|uniref:Type 1 glutamine amidotransferase-like domain-containing protein n=1 Tax=Bacillus cihuensis TaxID=1208599 RepID=UPI000425C3D5|nr:Type 1 glutamine amidotransferase-like domain-containing protein [Bacillus cihuensis]